MSDENVELSLSLGERFTLLFLLNSFTEPDRTNSVMRKTKRIKHAIRYKEFASRKFSDALDALIEDAGAPSDCSMDKDSFGFALSLFEKFKTWPTALDEWSGDLEDKLRAAWHDALKKKGE